MKYPWIFSNIKKVLWISVLLRSKANWRIRYLWSTKQITNTKKHCTNRYVPNPNYEHLIPNFECFGLCFFSHWFLISYVGLVTRLSTKILKGKKILKAYKICFWLVQCSYKRFNLIKLVKLGLMHVYVICFFYVTKTFWPFGLPFCIWVRHGHLVFQSGFDFVRSNLVF